jgi:hypothetical protein
MSCTHLALFERVIYMDVIRPLLNAWKDPRISTPLKEAIVPFMPHVCIV